MATYRNLNQSTKSANTQRTPIAEQNSKQAGAQSSTEEQPIPVNGFKQVVEMLQAADPAFRESLLARISRRDPALARSLREHF